jgi:hypothetical protein
MKIKRVGLVMVLLLGTCGTVMVGCGPAPPCETSLVTLDETRLDAETYEGEAAETGEKVADLESRLSSKQEEIDAIKDKPEELEKKVREMKKGSGRE